MPTLYQNGVTVPRLEGQCAFPSCTKVHDFKKEEILPIGWGTISITRQTKKGQAHQTMVVCVDHTIAFTDRQPRLKIGKKFQRVILESPFAGNVARNLHYLRHAMRNCLIRGEAPYASHALYTQPGVLDDNDKSERQLGIEAGLAWGEAAQKAIILTDLDVTPGMEIGIQRHKDNGIPVEKRKLNDWRDPT